ncbi:MAG: hypothetical protein ACXWWV_01925 [Candidatus Deferrimicrobiaceae bacterium]
MPARKFALTHSNVSTLHFKEQALGCKSCHAPDGLLDFGKLGYSGEKVKALSSVKE